MQERGVLILATEGGLGEIHRCFAFSEKIGVILDCRLMNAGKTF